MFLHTISILKNQLIGRCSTRVVKGFFVIHYWIKNNPMIHYWGAKNAIVICYCLKMKSMICNSTKSFLSGSVIVLKISRDWLSEIPLYHSFFRNKWQPGPSWFCKVFWDHYQGNESQLSEENIEESHL